MSFIAKLNTRNIVLLISITFILKLGFAVYFSQLGNCSAPDRSIGYLAKNAGDTIGYIGAIDNFIEEGNYYFWNGVRKVDAGRMPHYGAPYYVFRQAFSKSVASDIYVIIQLLLDSIANVFFAGLCFYILKRQFSFWLGYLFYFLNFNLFLLTLSLVPESISLSFMVLFLYTYHWYWVNQKLKYAVIASLFLAIVTVLKPYLVILYIPFFLSLLIKRENIPALNFKHIFRQGLIAGLPLIILLLPWVIRNEVMLGKFIPTQESMTAGYNYTESDFAFRRFVGAWGGDIIFWTPEAAGCYYYAKPPVACSFKIPDYALANGYTISDMEDVRQDYLQLQQQYSLELDQTVVNKFDHLTNIYKSEKPFMYYIGSRFLSIKNMFWHTNNYNVPINPSFSCYHSYQLLFKITQLAIYVLAMTFGVFGLIKLGYERKISVVFVCIPIFIICFFAIFKLTEARYFNHAYPLVLVGLVGFITWVVEKFRFRLKSNDIYK